MWNTVRRLQGQSDIPLNEFGKQLAKETRDGMAQIPMDGCFTSPLVRAKETAQIVLEGRNVPIVEDDRIREISFGVYEGLICKGERYEIPDPEFRVHFFEKPVLYEPPEGGESIEELKERTGDFLQELFTDPKWEGKTILVATHGAALCAMLSIIKGSSLEQFWGNGVQKNCAVTILEVEKGKAHIVEEGHIYYQAEVQDW